MRGQNSTGIFADYFFEASKSAKFTSTDQTKIVLVSTGDFRNGDVLLVVQCSYSRAGGNGTAGMAMAVPVFGGEKWRRLDSNLTCVIESSNERMASQFSMAKT